MASNSSILAAAKRRAQGSPPPNPAQKAAQGVLGAANAFGKATYDQPSKFPSLRPTATPRQQIAGPPRAKRFPYSRTGGA